MLRLIICGAAGRMGREIINGVKDLDDIAITAGIEATGHELVGKKLGTVPIRDNIATCVNECDCVIDFSNHRATINNLQKIKDHGKPYVIGTTGFTPSEIAAITRFSKKFPIFLSSNMSVGMNHLYHLVQSSARTLRSYDIEIIETHHRGKKDAPSGTALKIAQIIKRTRPGTRFIFGRKGNALRKNEICISAVRGGDVIGEHRILFMGNGEFIELRHYATSRKCFVQGTIAAAKYLRTRKRGLFSMPDLLIKIAH